LFVTIIVQKYNNFRWCSTWCPVVDISLSLKYSRGRVMISHSAEDSWTRQRVCRYCHLLETTISCHK